VSPRRFAEHLKVLRKYTQPMRLRQLSRILLRGNNPPHRSVVVTFDDGYADNLHNAKPLLERYNVPATFFLASGLIGQEQEFWWDELDRLLLQPGTLPETLRLSVNGNTHRWELGEGAYYSEEASRSHRHWRAWEEAPSSRHSLYYTLWQLLRPVTEDERRRVLCELREWAGAESVGRLSNRSLSLDEVGALAQGGLVEVGAHTVSHPALKLLPPASQRDEILSSKAHLEGILDHPVAGFSYPYGSLSAETVGIVREVGFAYACASGGGLVKRSADLFRLPRKGIQDWDGDEFARHLSEWFDVSGATTDTERHARRA
jgi:peptidoglycan/xylan/chitin deacetylase (PgdA/CDA1 family)